jgi:5-methyltetrahydropteroyltriglutamate--homocysteine methyltransferase
VELMLQFDRGELTDTTRLQQRIAEATDEVVQRQVQIGIDIPSDGEYGKASYATYVKERLTGFNGAPRNPGSNPGFANPEFPDWERTHSSPVQFPTCNGPVTLRDPSKVREDIRNFKSALQRAGHQEAFMSAASPGVIETFMPTTYYESDRAYLDALGSVMSDEYRAIVDAGFVLQIDCPDLAMSRTTRFSQLSDTEFASLARMHIEVLNRAIEGLPRSRTRLHLCWGNYEGPHNHDIPLKDILEVAMAANVGAISFEAANPRHEHEWKVFEGRRLPADLVLVPGVIDTCTNYIEHPDLVAQRVRRFADIIGDDRVIAGTDCGFGTSVGPRHVAPSIAWAKLESLVEGARLASAA